MEDGLLTGLTTDDEESIRTALQSSHPKSKIRQFLLKSLNCYHSCPLFFLFVKFIIGFLLIYAPCFLFFFHYQEKSNYSVAGIIALIAIICITVIFISFLFIRSCDDQINKGKLVATWERRNILRLLKYFFKGGFLIYFMAEIYTFTTDKKYNKVNLVNGYGEELKEYFFYRLLFYGLMMEIPKDHTFDDSMKLKFNYQSIAAKITLHNNFKLKIVLILIPIFILSIFSLIKTIFVSVKKPINKFIFHLLIIFNIIILIIYQQKNEISDSAILLFNYVQYIFIILLLLSQIIFILKLGFDRFKKRKESAFQMRKLPLRYTIAYFIFDLINSGAYSLLIVTASFGIFFEENYGEVITNLHFVRLSYIFLLLGHSVYFGDFLMKIIYEPIAYEYIPAKLKNKHYLHCSRNINFMLRNKPKKIFDKIEDL